jgi:putative DNA primase/helicase
MALLQMLDQTTDAVDFRENEANRIIAHNDNFRLRDVTEDGVATRFKELYNGNFLYCHQTGAWFRWDGNIWRKNETDLVVYLARLLARELSQGEEPKVKAAIQRTGFASGVDKFSRGDPAFAVTIDVWDTDPLKLSTPGGTIDLKTGVVIVGNPADRITKMTAIAPAQSEACPRWLAFLDETTGNDVELIRFLKQWCGYCLTANTQEHALVFVHGGGGNGKSVFLNTVTGIMADYATTAAMDTFTASQSDKHPTDLAMLRGARLVTASETEEGKAWAEARIKQLTGGDPISARFMRQDFFTFTPQFKLMIIGNHKPILQNIDEAARRRFNIIPFTRKPVTPDRTLEAKLKHEWPGILRWMINGCLDWQQNGLVRPQSIVTATNAYFAEQDFFGQWLEEACKTDLDNEAGLWDRSGDLFVSWKMYADAAAEKPGTSRGFAQNLQKRGYLPKRTGSARGYSGLRLKDSLGQ